MAKNNQTVTKHVIEEPVDYGGNPKAEHGMTVLERIVYLFGGIVIVILAIRFLLLLFAANPNSGFANFIYTITRPLAAPFFGLFNYNINYVNGQGTVEWASIVALVVYAILMVIAARLVTLGSHR